MGIKLSAIGKHPQNETQAGQVPRDGAARSSRATGAQPSRGRPPTRMMNDIHARYPKRYHTHRVGYDDLQGLMVLIWSDSDRCGEPGAGRISEESHGAHGQDAMLSLSVRNDIIGKSYMLSMLGTQTRRNVDRQTSSSIGPDGPRGTKCFRV